MRVPSNSELIAVWEQGSNEHPVDRALTLLSACSHESPDELARLSVGSRDTRLLEIYERFFGPNLDAFADCPMCGVALEYNLSACDLLSSATPENRDTQSSLKIDETSVTLRAPDSIDLRAVSQCTDVTSAARLLAERCVVEARIEDRQVSPDTLSDTAIDTIASTLAQLDPQAEILIDLTCVACTHPWQVTFDIEPFLWSKISATVRRLLQQVHALATAYGWRELDILVLSPTRRQMYVEMVRS
jgi:hypothetical protein